MTVGQYLERWLGDSAKPSVAAKTFERYEEIVNKDLIPAFGNTLLPKLQPIQIQTAYTKWLESGRKNPKTEKQEDGTVKIINPGLSAQSVIHFHRILHKALEQAVKWQLIARNPADAVEPPHAERVEMKTLDEKQVDRLLDACVGTAYYMPVLLAITTGMRRGEILRLRWDDIDLENRVLSVSRSLQQTRLEVSFKNPKTAKSRRRVDLPEMTVKALRVHKGEQAQNKLQLGEGYKNYGLVCCAEDGSPIMPDSLSNNFFRVCDKAKLPRVRFHDLRHTHATMMLQEGIHPKVVSERLGHSNIGITLDTYSHVTPTMGEDAARRLERRLQGENGG